MRWIKVYSVEVRWGETKVEWWMEKEGRRLWKEIQRIRRLIKIIWSKVRLWTLAMGIRKSGVLASSERGSRWKGCSWKEYESWDGQKG